MSHEPAHILAVHELSSPLMMCQCVGKHIPKPMELHKHHIWPIGEGGPDSKTNLVLLCPSTHSNVHRLWRLYDQYQGRPPWYLLKGYSEYARYLVEKGREQRRVHETSGTVPESQTLPL